MPDLEWSEEYGGHLRALRGRLLVGEVCWYQDASTQELYWAGFANQARIPGRFGDAEAARAAVEQVLR